MPSPQDAAQRAGNVLCPESILPDGEGASWPCTGARRSDRGRSRPLAIGTGNLRARWLAELLPRAKDCAARPAESVGRRGAEGPNRLEELSSAREATGIN